MNLQKNTSVKMYSGQSLAIRIKMSLHFEEGSRPSLIDIRIRS